MKPGLAQKHQPDTQHARNHQTRTNNSSKPITAPFTGHFTIRHAAPQQHVRSLLRRDIIRSPALTCSTPEGRSRARGFRRCSLAGHVRRGLESHSSTARRESTAARRRTSSVSFREGCEHPEPRSARRGWRRSRLARRHGRRRHQDGPALARRGPHASPETSRGGRRALKRDERLLWPATRPRVSAAPSTRSSERSATLGPGHARLARAAASRRTPHRPARLLADDHRRDTRDQQAAGRQGGGRRTGSDRDRQRGRATSRRPTPRSALPAGCCAGSCRLASSSNRSLPTACSSAFTTSRPATRSCGSTTTCWRRSTRSGTPGFQAPLHICDAAATISCSISSRRTSRTSGPRPCRVSDNPVAAPAQAGGRWQPRRRRGRLRSLLGLLDDVWRPDP